MWSASVAGALLHITQVWGPVAKSSLRALLNSGVARRVMLFRFFSDALGWRLRLSSCYGLGLSRYCPPHFELLTQAVGCCYQRTPTLVFMSFIRCTPAQAWGSTLLPQCAYQQSAIPYVAVSL
jgi:hypothetical protein